MEIWDLTLINVVGVNVPWAKEFLLQARRSIDCFQDSMPLSIRHWSEGSAEAYKYLKMTLWASVLQIFFKTLCSIGQEN